MFKYNYCFNFSESPGKPYHNVMGYRAKVTPRKIEENPRKLWLGGGGEWMTGLRYITLQPQLGSQFKSCVNSSAATWGKVGVTLWAVLPPEVARGGYSPWFTQSLLP